MKNYRYVCTVFVLTWQFMYIHNVWHTLPQMLPSHFGLDGLPNRYAPRIILWILFGIAAFVVLFLRILEGYPQTFNLPKPIGDPDRPRLEAITINLLSWMQLEIACLFAYITWSIVQVGTHKSSGLGASFTLIAVTVVTLTVIYFITRLKSPQSQP